MDAYVDFVMYCVIDQKPIPLDRAIRRSNTCSRECANELSRIRRLLIDSRKCRLCGTPNSPEERAQFLKWRREAGMIKPKGRPVGSKDSLKRKRTVSKSEKAAVLQPDTNSFHEAETLG